ncbi:hypothetical protein IT774_09785 [Salinimonas marina]|uniref:Uncharacterized protein n=1 Tax=Salinimonas marina TaxID=2785918 RepID=A0A7S9DVJ0_9ALTE|nr:hypothetical protein [Salinimonas marina]QPG04533.1 hypothetical protein IT774_09785 [Salinimonas marina]
MRISPPENMIAIPDGYESCDVVGINYRYFSIWLEASLLAQLTGVVTEVRFPWSQAVNADNYLTRLNRLPEYALDTMALMQTTMQAQNCRIISCEADKFRCALALVAPLPQIVYQGLQSMPCPDMFSMPQMVNIDKNPTQYIQAHRKRHES